MLPHYNIQKLEYLAYHTGINLTTIIDLSHNISKHYKSFEIPKKNNPSEKRLINQPKTELKNLLKKLLIYIYYNKTLPDQCNGGVPNKSTITHATPHVKKGFLLCLDIKDYFPSISKRDIRELHIKMGFAPPVATLLSKLVTYNNRLPQGSPTSPILANLYLVSKWKAIHDFCKNNNLTISTYMDDIAISSNHNFEMHIPVKLQLFENRGLNINQSKIKYSKPGEENIITGISVSDKLNLPRSKRLKYLELAKSIKVGKQVIHNDSWKGHLSYIKSVNKKFGKTLEKITNSTS